MSQRFRNQVGLVFKKKKILKFLNTNIVTFSSSSLKHLKLFVVCIWGCVVSPSVFLIVKLIQDLHIHFYFLNFFFINRQFIVFLRVNIKSTKKQQPEIISNHKITTKTTFFCGFQNRRWSGLLDQIQRITLFFLSIRSKVKFIFKQF